MTRIAEQTSSRLVVENKPRLAFGIVITLGLVATIATVFSVLDPGKGFTTHDIFGSVLGPLLLTGGTFLYRETTTVFDKQSHAVNWMQRGLAVKKSNSARLGDVQDVVVGRPTSDQGGGASALVLVLSDRRWPLSFGFSAFNAQNAATIAAIRQFIDGERR